MTVLSGALERVSCAKFSSPQTVLSTRGAVAYAARRAKSEPCKIYLLHVEKPMMAWEVGPVSSIEAVSTEREAKSREVLDAGVGRFDQTPKSNDLR